MKNEELNIYAKRCILFAYLSFIRTFVKRRRQFNPKMSLERFSSFIRMKALLFGIFLFLTASCSQASLAVARYNFETLETKLLDINEKSARSLMTFLGLSAARAERNLPVSVANACRPGVLHAKATLKLLYPYGEIHARTDFSLHNGEIHANRFARKFLILNS